MHLLQIICLVANLSLPNLSVFKVFWISRSGCFQKYFNSMDFPFSGYLYQTLQGLV